MPSVPDNPYADVAPSAAPTPEFTLRPMVSPATSEAAFGAPVAAGLGRLGEAITQQELAQQGLKNESTATDAQTGAVKKAGMAAAKYLTLQGKNAADGLPAFQQQLEDIRQSTAASMPNPDARRMFDHSFRRYQDSMLMSSAEHAGREDTRWHVQSATDAASNWGDQAVTFRNDPVKVAQYVASGEGEIRKRGEIEGWDDNQMQAGITAWRGQVYANIIAPMAAEDPLRAKAMFDAVAPSLPGHVQAALARELAPKLRTDVGGSFLDHNGLPMPGAGGGAAGVGTPAPVTGDNAARAKQVYDAFVQRGWSEPAAWGLAANGHWESGNSPEVVSDGGRSTGVFQWNDERRAAYVQRYGHDPGAGSLAENVQFADWELRNTEAKAGTALAAATTSDQAARIVSSMFLRPANSAAEESRRGRTALQLEAANGPPGATPQGAATGALDAGPAPDMAAITRKAVATFGNDPQMLEHVLGEAARRDSIWKSLTAQDREKLTRDLGDLRPALLGGGDFAIPEDRIRRLMPPDEAQQTLRDLAVAQVAGQVVKSVQWATPEDPTRTVQDFDTGHGPASDRLRALLARGGTAGAAPVPGAAPAADQPESPAAYTLRKQISAMLLPALRDRQQRLQTDPAAYAADDTNVARLAAAIDPQKPETFEAYAAATTGLQKHLGVAGQDTRVLSGAQARGTAASLLNADPATNDIGGRLDAMQHSYGNAWPQVWHDLVRDGKLPGDFQVLGSLQPGPDRMVVQRALQAAAAKGGLKAMAEDADPTERQTVDKGLAATLADFSRTVMVPGLRGDTALLDTVRNAVRTVALYDVLSGKNGTDALAHAAAAVLPYDYEGPSGEQRARAPKGQGIAASDFADGVISRLTPQMLALPDGAKGMTEADAGAAALAAVRRNHTWLTMPNGNGWDLWTRGDDGKWTAVVGRDKQQIGFRFADMKAPVPAASVDTTSWNSPNEPDLP